MVVLALDIEAVRVAVGLGIAVRRPEREADRFALGDGTASDHRLARADAASLDDWAVEPQHLLYRGNDQFRLFPELSALVGVAKQRQHTVPDQIGRRNDSR